MKLVSLLCLLNFSACSQDTTLLRDLSTFFKSGQQLQIRVEVALQKSIVYVSPDGIGDASLSVALTKLTPGKTLVLKEGLYKNIDFQVTMPGPYTIAAQGKVVVDCLKRCLIKGNDVTITNIEFYTDSWIGDRFMSGQNLDFSIEGPRTTIKNCVIHDFSNVGLWSNAPDSHFEGNLVYSIGYGNGSQGHSLYTQNAEGTMVIRNNIFLLNYNSAFVLHQYGSGGARGLRGFRYDHNIFYGARCLMGSPATKISDVVFNNNVIIKGALELGSLGATDPPHEFSLDGNRLWDANFNIKRAGVLNLTNTKATFPEGKPNGNIVNVTSGNIDYNRYRFYGPTANVPYNRYNVNFTYGYGPNALLYVSQQTGFEKHSTEEVYLPGIPPDEIDVNVYEPTRANVAIANYSQATTVNVVLTGLESGVYDAINCQNPAESFSFTYSGQIIGFPMTGWTRTVPLATAGGAMISDGPAWLMYPKFGIFKINKRP